MGYLSNFIVYMLAMIGVIMIALFVFKQVNGTKVKASNGKGLKVVDSLTIGARKTLYVISAGSEKFLIAGDVDRTTLISKLEGSDNEIAKLNLEERTTGNFSDTISELQKRPIRVNKSELGIKTIQNTPYDSVMKSLAEKMRG